jgi:N-acetylglucosaminyl-diphospho-decaprenol L-rhamnosyltransferase
MESVTVPGVTAAVVSYNTSDRLSRCLDSLETESLSSIIVVDNASSDGSAEMARRRPSVRVIANSTNGGYGAAANQALRAARTKYVLLLNADTEVRPGASRVLAEYLDAHPTAAIAAPRLENPDGSHQYSCFPFPGTIGWFCENGPMAALVRAIPSVRERSVTFRTSPHPRPVPWTLGAALLLRRDAVLEQGGFEESFFMYFEEVDLAYRLTRAGWLTHFVPDAVVMHVGGASTSKVRTAMLVQRFRSTREYYRRHATGATRAFWTTLLWARWSARLVRDSARLLITSHAGKRTALRHDISAWWSALFVRPGAAPKPACGIGASSTPGDRV